MGLDTGAARVAVLGAAAAATFGPLAAPLLGAAISIGGNLAIGVVDARRARAQIDANKRQGYVSPTLPPADGLVVVELPSVPGATDPGPDARMAALRHYFDVPPSSPWDRMLLDELDGYPMIRGIGARVLAAYPHLAEPREESSDTWTTRCKGTCMRPWLDNDVEVTIDPAASPAAGDIVAAFFSHAEVDPMGKWLLSSIPPRDEWNRHADAVAVFGSADEPTRMIAVPLVALDMVVRIAPPAREPAVLLDAA